MKNTTKALNFIVKTALFDLCWTLPILSIFAAFRLSSGHPDAFKTTFTNMEPWVVSLAVSLLPTFVFLLIRDSALMWHIQTELQRLTFRAPKDAACSFIEHSSYGIINSLDKALTEATDLLWEADEFGLAPATASA